MSSYIDVPENRKALQTALKSHQFYTGAIDGILGPASLSAMQAVERAIGIPLTTYFDPRILPFLGLSPQPQMETSSMLSLLPTIVQWIIALLPGIPDDINIVEAELKELASTDSGKQKLITALAFAKTLVAKIETVLGVPAV